MIEIKQFKPVLDDGRCSFAQRFSFEPFMVSKQRGFQTRVSLSQHDTATRHRKNGHRMGYLPRPNMKNLTLRLGICFIAEVFDLAICVVKVKKTII